MVQTQKKAERFDVSRLRLEAGMTFIPSRNGGVDISNEGFKYRDIDGDHTVMLMGQVFTSCWLTEFEDCLRETGDGRAIRSMHIEKFLNNFCFFMNKLAPELDLKQTAQSWSSAGYDGVVFYFSLEEGRAA